MERKIGEIFEYKGEWYQCVEGYSCGDCALFDTICKSGTKEDVDNAFGKCSGARRNQSVIFKKLKKQEDMEENKLNLKPFDIQKAREGKPVCTRDGRKARIVCFDAKGDKPIIALVEAKGNKDALIEKVERYFINGHSVFEVRETNNDLMMLPEKKEGWVNIYKERCYATKEEAIKNKYDGATYVDTVKIKWEE